MNLSFEEDALHVTAGSHNPPYSFNIFGVPQDVVVAVKSGFGANLDDFDCREVEWSEPPVIGRSRVFHSNRNFVRRDFARVREGVRGGSDKVVWSSEDQASGSGIYW